jgi:ATP-binding cassette subfamily B protein
VSSPSSAAGRSEGGATDIHLGELAAPVRSLPEIARRFRPLTRPDRPLLLAAALLLIVAAAADTVAVLQFMDVVDGVVSSGSMTAYWAPAGVWVGVALVGAATTALGSYLSGRGAERFLLRVRDRVFAHLQRLGPDFF